MAGRKSALRSGRQQGFTLLEVLLVGALIVVVLALAVPNLRTGLADQRLIKAAETVRAQWAKARVRAIKTGRVQIYQHALLSDRFMMTEQMSADDEMMLLQTQTNTAASSAISRSPLQSNLGQLPQSARFLGADVRLDQRSTVLLSSLPDPSQALDPRLLGSLATGLDRDLQWGSPIFFFPDGTTSTARLVIFNDRQRSITLWLRGLTGYVTLDRVTPLSSFGSPQEIIR